MYFIHVRGGISDGFAVQCTVRNKPYDVFGTWYNNDHLLSGNLHWLGNFSSCSVIYLNKVRLSHAFACVRIYIMLL